MPTPNVSVVDLVVQTERKTFAEEVNEAFREAAKVHLHLISLHLEVWGGGR